MQRELWSIADHPYAAGSGAAKLVDSAVAPLVAYARGMYSITPDNLRATLAKLHVGAGNSKAASKVKTAVGTTDALYMPWYTAESINEMQKSGFDVSSPAPQLRPNPANVTYNDKGKPIKYINMPGSSLVFGPHPSTPAGWLNTGGHTMMFTEGMLKADSALTAYLLAHGFTADDLLVTDADDADLMAARRRLTAMLDTISGDDIVVIMGLVSVTTFGHNAEWNAVNAKDADVYVAFDGDTATNFNVWRGAKNMFDTIEKKKGRPHLIDFSGVEDPDGNKVGMDDYLAVHGDWNTMLTLKAPLPPSPKGEDDPEPGEWRMNPTTKVCEEFRPGPEEGDSGTWIVRHQFMARVGVVEDRRSVSDEELTTGVHSHRSDAREMTSQVEIEVSWIDRDGATRRGIISGPAELLSAVPSEWRRIQGYSVPSDVAMLPTWPPTEREFLRAMKEAEPEEQVTRPLWNHMGWVPTVDSTPVFLVGDQVIGSEGEMPAAAATAVTSNEISNADRFGVIVPDSDDEAREAVRAMLDLYRPDEPRNTAKEESKCPWQNPDHASIFIAAALRPTVPIRTGASVVLTGDSGAGKALPMDALLPVPVSAKFPTGWARNDQLEVGDAIFGPDGAPTGLRRLSKVFDDEQMFELAFDDGRTLRASGSHVMVVSSARSRAARRTALHCRETAMLRDLAARHMSGGDGVPLAEVAQLTGYSQSCLARIADAKGLPHDQVRFVGAGGDRQVRHYPAAELFEAIAEWVEHGRGEPDPLTRSLTVAELAERAGEGWAVPLAGPVHRDGHWAGPDPYLAGVELASGPVDEARWSQVMLAGVQTRHSILDGVLDALGHRLSSNTTTVTASAPLADKLAALVWSLGWKAWRTPAADAVEVTFVPSGDGWAYLTGIRRVGDVPSRCLQVDHPSGCFLAGDYLVTHNSWASGATMMFWQHRPGLWHDKKLPGSASDTAAAAEVAVSKTPIWVVDDLAPSDDDPTRHGRQADAVWQLVRAVHNGQARARRRSDMTAQEKNTPRALLMVSAEQTPEHQQSIMNRMIHVHVRAKQFLSISRDNTDQVKNAGATWSPQSLVTGYVLRMLARRMRAVGWPQVVADFNAERAEHEAQAKDLLGDGGEGTRQVEVVSDLALGLTALDWMIADLDLTEELGGRVAEMCRDLYAVAAAGYKSSQDIVPGRQFVSSIASALKSHRAYVGALGVAGPPVPKKDDDELGRRADTINDLLGWDLSVDGEPSARSPRIGWLTRHRDGEIAVVFDAEAAYNVVRGDYKTRSARTLWESAAQYGLRSTSWSTKKSGGGAGWKQRVTSGGETLEGVAVPLYKLFGYTDASMTVVDESE